MDKPESPIQDALRKAVEQPTATGPLDLLVANGDISKKTLGIALQIDATMAAIRESAADPIEHLTALKVMITRLNEEGNKLAQVSDAYVRSLVMKERTIREIDAARQAAKT